MSGISLQAKGTPCYPTDNITAWMMHCECLQDMALQSAGLQHQLTSVLDLLHYEHRDRPSPRQQHEALV